MSQPSTSTGYSTNQPFHGQPKLSVVNFCNTTPEMKKIQPELIPQNLTYSAFHATCISCKMTFTSKTRFISHRNWHNSLKFIRCRFCSVRYFFVKRHVCKESILQHKIHNLNTYRATNKNNLQAVSHAERKISVISAPKVMKPAIVAAPFFEAHVVPSSSTTTCSATKLPIPAASPETKKLQVVPAANDRQLRKRILKIEDRDLECLSKVKKS